MDKLIFLGTGHALAYHCYTTCLVLNNEDHYFMTDAGGGNNVLLQMERAEVATEKVTDLFVSHIHTDHLVGAIWLVRVIGHQFDRGGRTAPLTIYGHESVLATLREICSLIVPQSVVAHFDKEIIFHAVADGDTCAIGPWQVTFFDTGALKTTQYGWRATLTNGKTLVFLGDEPMREADLPWAAGADYLVHEAMCLASEEEIYHPHRIKHSTVVDAADNATRAGAGALILFHGEDTGLDTRKARYTAEARTHFDGPVYAPDDLDVITLN
ncbi:MAG: MBL fold metallo-hydrolase [Peptococcaceae bacterium]|nr:MBL fold metallo-hydrolase [Peptococcaceae bacterium]